MTKNSPFKILVARGFAHLNSFNTLNAIAERAEAVLWEVNGFSGWTIIMWQKLGCMEDAAARTANAGVYYAPVEHVKDGTVVHHIVSLSPTSPETINPVTIRERIVNMNELTEQDY